MKHQPTRNSEIVIVGAGPAGLAAAYFLKARGYRNVTVMERLGRVGGLCFTATEDYTCFDLGANYLTPDYREVRRLAREFGIESYAEKNFLIAEINASKPGYRQRSPWEVAKGELPLHTFIGACLAYAWKRWRLGPVVDLPGHRNISSREDLCVPFLTWLQQNGLGCLETMFEMPISIMGYGYLNEIPAPYALKYMSLPTFLPMCLKAFPLTRWYWWPRRFTLGYQWLWECVARELNVWLGVEIQAIDRSGPRLAIDYVHREQRLNSDHKQSDRFEFDYLILACPLVPDVLSKFLTLSPTESKLFGQVVTAPYCMTSFKVDLPGLPTEFAMATIPLTPIGTPWAITKQEATSRMVQFYSRLDPEDLSNLNAIQARVIASAKETIARLGGNPEQANHDSWHSFDIWPYFKHVSAEAIASGFYDELESIQGTDSTFYVGGLLDFELVERITRYSKRLVEERFPVVS